MTREIILWAIALGGATLVLVIVMILGEIWVDFHK
jgi:hypothetical protein